MPYRRGAIDGGERNAATAIGVARRAEPPHIGRAEPGHDAMPPQTTASFSALYAPPKETFGGLVER